MSTVRIESELPAPTHTRCSSSLHPCPSCAIPTLKSNMARPRATKGSTTSDPPPPGAFFRIPLGRGLPAFGQVLSIAADHALVRTLHTTTSDPTPEDLAEAEDLIPHEAVTLSGFRDRRWRVLDRPRPSVPAPHPGPTTSKPIPPVHLELKIARRRTEIGMGPDPDA